MQIQLIADPARHLKRWRELSKMPELARWPGKVETDRFGHILMSRPSEFDHSRRVGKIIKLLNQFLAAGQTMTEAAVVTLDGVKLTDAAWLSPGYAAELAIEHPAALEHAPEICVEVLSPSNTEAEMNEKRDLYFEAGAKEVWLCDTEGRMRFFVPEPSAKSTLCPELPQQL